MAVKLQERPIFIIGSERSGTTLLLAILACHRRIAVPEVTWYYPRFRPYLHTFGDLAEAQNFTTLVDQMAHGLRVPLWRMTDANPATFGAEIEARADAIERSFAGVFAAMFERYAGYVNKPRWGEKTPANVFYIEQVLQDFPNAQFVYIYRDCRDASAEFIASQFGPTNAYNAALMWNDGQQAVKPFRDSLAADQWLNVRYEDFVREPVQGLREVCEFLGEEYDDALMEFHTTPVAQRRGKTRDNRALAHPISERHVGIYKNQLSPEQQGVISWVAGDLMRELGYTDLADPIELEPGEIDLVEEMDGRFRAATLDAPGGWIVYESYGDWLIDQREARRQAGIWSRHPDPAPFPIGHPHEEYYAGMRALRKWKQHFAVKRDYSQARTLL